MKKTEHDTRASAAASGRTKGRRRLLAQLGLAGGIVGAMAVLISAGWSREDAIEKPLPRILAVEAFSVQERDSYEVESRFVGRVEAVRSSELGFELAGTVMALHVEEGDLVEAGQLLAELDTARLQARRTELVAAAEEARANQQLASVTLERAERLVKSGAVSKQRLDEAQRQVATADSALKRIEAQIQSIEVNFAKSQLRAPYAGVVVARRIDEGSVLAPGSPIIRLLESGRLQMRVGLTPSAVSELQPGERVDLTDQAGNSFAATVTGILPERSETTRTIDVILTASGELPAQNLRDGDLVQLRLPRVIAERGFWLPRAALTESVRGLWAVYALVPAGPEGLSLLERRQIEIVHQAGEQLFVRGALADGEQIAAVGLHRLVPGQRVRPISLPLARNQRN